MDGKVRVFSMVLVALLACTSCGRGGKGDVVVGPYVPSVSSPVKIQIVDVSNDTHEVYDVDVIGLLWTGLDDALKKRGMLWTKESGGKMYSLEAHVVRYRKGSQSGRVVPKLGDTVLFVRCDLMDGGARIATIEVKKKISFGDKLFSSDAWRQIFTEVSEEVVAQATRKL